MAGNLTELQNLSSLLEKWKDVGQVSVLNEVTVNDQTLPIYGLSLGSKDPSAPTLGIFGGVHGLERVGTHVVLNFLGPLIEQYRWDKTLKKLFENFRLVSIPIVNPGGMYLSQRSNPQGVDVMRNAPIDAEESSHFLVSGHRISPRLPWYRGSSAANMEIETESLIQFVKNQMLTSQFSIALDIHSGFGMRDRLWYPYSRTRTPFPYIDNILELKKMLRTVQPFHIYKIEAQNESYLIHGDPWDYLFDMHRESADKDGSKFIPLCLEMGSWTWLKKNPMQLFFNGGIFNPIIPHRYSRIMRRHRPLIDFLKQVVINHKSWEVAS